MVLESNTLDVLFVKDGQQGEDGKVLYTWIKYAKDANGTGMTDDPNGAIYIGISYNNESSIESNDPTQYAWTKIQGADGKKGEDAYTIFLENENISFATDENRNPLSEQAYTSGITIMKGAKPVTDFAIGDIAKTQGIAVAKTNTAIAISVVNGNPLPNDSGEIEIPITVGGTVFKKILTWTCAKKGDQGEQGERGLQGIQGPQGIQGVAGKDGTNGKTTYFHIKYSSVANPTSSSQLTETPSTYIGTYVDFTETDSTDPKKYTWSQFVGSQGPKGEQGIAGVGVDGKTSYLHIAYANSADGKTGFSTSDSTNKSYIGQYTDFTPNDSTDYTKYSWSLIRGKDGTDGVSPTVSVTKNGKTTTITITDKNGTHTQTVKDGTDGTPGQTGKDGKTTYFHVKYSNDGGQTFTSNSGEDVGAYIGTCTDYNQADPTTVGVYTWARIKGEKGDQGVRGEKGKDGTSVTITNKSITYQLSTSGTTIPTGTWQTSPQTIPEGQYQWTKTSVTYSDGNKTESYSISYHGKNGSDGTSVKTTSTSVKYQVGDSGTTKPTGTWQSNVPTVAQGKYLWTQTVVNYSDGNSTESYSVSYRGIDGSNGSNGMNAATVYLYQRATSTPSKPSNTLTYTFSTTKITGTLSNGWSTAIPTGTDAVYVTVASVSSKNDTTTIAASAWSAPVVLAQNGKTGSDGKAGLNVATIYLYQRNISKPSKPSASVTYTFSTGVASGLNNGWSQKIPDGTNPLYVTLATASSNTATDTILSSEWSDVVVMAQNGEDGQDGAGFHWNLLKYSGDLSKQVLGGAGTYTATVESIEDKTTPSGQAEKITYTVQGTGGKFIQTGKYIKEGDIKQGKTYTVSVWCKCSSIKSTGVINAEFLDNKTYVNPTLSTEWQQYVVTGVANKDVTSTSSASAISFYYNDNMSVGDIFYISSPKVEEGDKPSPWCTTYEETLAKNLSITPSSQYFKSTDGGKTFAPNTITIKPTIQGEINFGKWQYSIDGGVSFADVVSGQKGLTISNNVLTVSKDSSLYSDAVTMVTFRAVASDSSFYDTCSIAKIYDVSDIGDGRNLLWNSNFAKTDETINTSTYTTWGLILRGSTYTATIDTSVKHNNFNTLKVIGTKAGENGGQDLIYRIKGLNLDEVKFTEIDVKYTLSFYAKASIACNFSARYSYDSYAKDTNVALSTDWKRYEIQMHPTTASYQTSLIFKMDAASTVWFSEFKLEKGSSATGYSTAPEDLQTAILSTKSEISDVSLKVDKNKQAIEQRVEKTTYEQDLNLVKGDISKANEGLNKWRYEIYPKSLFASEYQGKSTMDVFAKNTNLTPSQSVLINDMDLSIAWNYDNNYIGYALTFAKFSAAKSVAITFAHDDGAHIYLNGKLIGGNDVYNNKGESLTLGFVKGWNCIEVVVNECASTEGFKLGTTLSAISECQLMNCYYGTPVARQSHITNQLVQNTTDINGISTKVSKVTSVIGEDGKNFTDFKNDYSDFKQTMNGFKTTVGQTYVTKDDFDGLQIGGRNLLLYSANLKNGYYTNIYDTADETFKGCSVFKVNHAWNGIRPYFNKHITERNVIKAGDVLTYSVYAKTDDTKEIDIMMFNRTMDSDSGQGAIRGNQGELKLSNDWKLYSVTFKVTESMLSVDKGLSWFGYELCNNTSSGKYVYFACPKLENSNKPTDWTPAPEDVNGKIVNVETIANQTANKLEWIVKGGDSSSNFTLTDRVADLVAERINFKGLVTFSGLSTDAKSDILNSFEVGGRNLVKKKQIQGIDSAMLNLDNFLKNGTIEFNVKSTNDGFKFDSYDNYEPNSNYVLSYYFTKTNGTITKFGGFHNGKGNIFTKYTVDGIDYESSGYSTESSTVGAIMNDGNRHRVVVCFTTPSSIKTDDAVNFTYIQPGRGNNNPNFGVKIEELKLEKGNKATDWTPAPEDVSQDATNKASQALTDAKNYSSNAVNWVTNNGSSTTSLNSMVKKWTDGAVSDTTQINGGWLKANTITASKIAIGDFTNYCQLDKDTASFYGFTATDDTKGVWFTANPIDRDKDISQWFTCEGGQKLYVEYDLSTTVKGKVEASDTDISYLTSGIMIYAANGAKQIVSYTRSKGVTATSDGAITHVSLVETLPADTRFFKVVLQTNGQGNTFSGTLKIRNPQVRKATTGKLIVDGSITADKIAANAITADKIATDAIKSHNYISSGGTQGSFLNLKDGSFTAPNLSWDLNGNLIAKNANLSGQITATKGSIGGWSVDNYSIYTTYDADQNIFGSGISGTKGKYVLWAGETNNAIGANRSSDTPTDASLVIYNNGGLEVRKTMVGNDKKNHLYTTILQSGQINLKMDDNYIGTITATDTISSNSTVTMSHVSMAAKKGYGWSILHTDDSGNLISDIQRDPSDTKIKINSPITVFSTDISKYNAIETTGDVVVSGKIHANYGSNKIQLNPDNNGSIELYGYTPFIDFHYGNSDSDYTSRIIAQEWGLQIVGTATVTGDLYCDAHIYTCTNGHFSWAGQTDAYLGCGNYSGGNNIYYYANYHAFYVNNDSGSGMMYINTNGVTSRVGFTKTSDERIKKNFESFDDNIIDAYMNIEPVKYQLKQSSNDNYHFGFKAQHVDKVFSDYGDTYNESFDICTSRPIDPDKAKELYGVDDMTEEYGLRYDELIAPTTYMVQHIYKELESTKGELAKVKQEKADLETRLQAIEAKLRL